LPTKRDYECFFPMEIKKMISLKKYLAPSTR